MKKELMESALACMQNAYSPYSQYKVAAAVLTSTGHIYSGINIENASYGATVCAERVAIWNAISSEGKISIKEILVLTKEGWSPCGLCRQVMSEFANKNTVVHIAKLSRKKALLLKSLRLTKLLPMAFSI